MKCISTLIIALLFTVNISSSEKETKSDELTLRNQLFADVFLLKEGVDRLQISVEVLNKRFNNQMEILKGLQMRLPIDDADSEAENGVCDRITGMFNTTLRRHNILESRLITKLDDLREDQTARLDEIILKQKISKSCNSHGESSTTLSVLSTAVTDLADKIAKLEEKLSSQQTELHKVVLSQLSINQDQFEKLGKELVNLKEQHSDVNKAVTYPRPKLSKEMILGITSSNISSLK